MLRTFLHHVRKFGWSRVQGKSNAKRRRRRANRTVERLEARALLATVVNSTTLTYQDIDGDRVTVAFSKPILSQSNVNSIFTFSPLGTPQNNSSKQQLRSINLANIAAAAGTTITTTAVRNATTGGDGFAAVGQINATGRDLGNVTIDGDLGRILAGNANTATPGLGALVVHSMGRFGRFTGAVNLHTIIQGKLTSLKTTTDIVNAFIDVQGGANGKLDSVMIGGSIIGGAADASGVVFSTGDMGPVTVTGDIRGGDGVSSGQVFTNGKVTSVTVGGSIVGGTNSFSGLIGSILGTGPVKIGGDVIGGENFRVGEIFTSGKLTSVSIGGSLIGGSGESSGRIYSELDMGPVKITRDVQGGGSYRAGSIISNSKLASVTIGGSLRGGSGAATGQVFSGSSMGPVNVTGSVIGGTFAATLDDQSAGAIMSNATLASVTIGGSLIGGSGRSGGKISSLQNMGAVKITGNVQGGTGSSTGRIVTKGKLASVTISGSLIGGEGIVSGRIDSDLDMGAVKITGDVLGVGGSSANIGTDGRLASLTIGGSLISGGEGTYNAYIFSRNDMGAVNIKGDLRGGAMDGGAYLGSGGKMASVTIGGSLIGGSGSYSGYVAADGELTTLSIAGDIRGGSARGSASLFDAGFVEAARIGTMAIGGSVIAGIDNTTGAFRNSGAIRVENDIASLTINGSLIGNTTNPVVISARGQLAPVGTVDLAIGTLTVNGRVEYASILAGVNISGDPKNTDAQIGTVMVGGDWIASNLVAGAVAGADNKFGTMDDAAMSGVNVKDLGTVISKIGSVTIGGQVFGTVAGGDHFGFVAEIIGSFKVTGGTSIFTLRPGRGNDNIVLGLFRDIRLKEVQDNF